jgi:DNA (cytosine-5)-methyltransferase 1
VTGPRIGELFAGYGGLGMGVQAVYGGDVAWVSEFDKGANKILAHRFPDVPNHGDITKIDWSAVEPVDILTGGSPCQDLSHAGRRAGMTEGTRSNLWVAMREAIAQLRPPMVAWENVGGAFSAAAHSEVEPCAGCLGDGPGVYLRALGRVLGDLSSLGYDASWHALRAADVGAPHGRLRVFVAAYPSGLRRGPRGTAGPDEATGRRAPADLARCGDTPSRAATVMGRTGAAGPDRTLVMLPTPQAHDARGRAGEGFNEGGSLINALFPTPQAHDAKQGSGESAEQRQGEGRFPNPALADIPHLLPTPMAAEGIKAVVGQSVAHREDGGHHVWLTNHARDYAETGTWGQYAAAIARWEALTRPAPPPTELGPKGSPRLSAAFSEWMMGLPAGWITDVPGITRNEALKACGNGVVPQQAAEALRVMAAWEVAA